MTGSEITAARLAAVMKQDQGRLLAALIRQLGDFQLAEDVLQDATEAALRHWKRNGPPTNPQGWLLKVARRKAIDRLRRDANWHRKSAEMTVLMEQDAITEVPEIPDERLRLIFTCCHPALDRKSQVALTLRMLGGLTTREIAHAFLDREAAMGQRISRAKARIAAAGIPFRIPGSEEWDARLDAVLTVIYLVFNEGYSTMEGDAPIRAGLCEEALWLGDLLDRLCPRVAEIEGVRALMMLAHARRRGRLDRDGAPIAPEAQDRGLWDRDMIETGLAILDRAVARRRPGPFQIQAAISALYMDDGGDGPDWRQMLLLYDRLLDFDPSPVVALNRAVVLAEVSGNRAALDMILRLEPELGTYQPFHAAKAEFLTREGRRREALAAYDRGIALARNKSDILFLRRRRDGVREA